MDRERLLELGGAWKWTWISGKVFPFLAEDPVYLEAIRCERVTREVIARIWPTLEEIVSEMAVERVTWVIESARDILKDVLDLTKEFDEHLEAHRRDEDAADWWKQGGGAEEED